MKRAFSIFLVLVFLGGQSGCATLGSKVGPTQATQAQTEVPEELLVDVGIEVFDTGIPEDADLEELAEDGVFPEVREAEARYIPFRLKEILRGTGYWGAVWVTTPHSDVADVVVRGEIEHSDGENLVLRVEAVDSSGRRWMLKKYKSEADLTAYVDGHEGSQEPFGNLFNAIANDLLAERQEFDAAEIEEIRTISALRFAKELAPQSFADYLTVDRNGVYRIERLPAKDDPMLARILKVRERDYASMDVLNQYYENLSDGMQGPYRDWRRFSYDDIVALREMQRSARLHKVVGVAAVVGGLAAAIVGLGPAVDALAGLVVGAGVLSVRTGMQRGAESRIHAEAIRELGVSFGNDVEPLVVEVEGQTVRLTGSAETQYEKWRRLLRDIYWAETGFDPDGQALPDVAAEGDAAN